MSLTACQAATRLLVTVVDQRSGQPVTGLKAEDFTVLDDNAPRQVETAEPATGLLEVMLLLDTSLLGASVQPVAENLIAQLQPKEQMAVVAFHSTPDLVQDFTSSRELLLRAVTSVKFGNTPRMLDALYAAIDGGFRASTFRRVVVLLTAGVEGPSRMSEREVLRLARRNGVSIYPVYAMDQERSMLERLARQTGGASFSLPQKGSRGQASPAARVFEVMRSPYTLTLSGNLALGDRFKIEAKKKAGEVVHLRPAIGMKVRNRDDSALGRELQFRAVVIAFGVERYPMTTSLRTSFTTNSEGCLASGHVELQRFVDALIFLFHPFVVGDQLNRVLVLLQVGLLEQNHDVADLLGRLGLLQIELDVVAVAESLERRQFPAVGGD